MKKISKYMLSLILVLNALAFMGCATDTAYQIGKTIYIGGKAVVIQNADLLDDKTLETLKKADEYAKRYDKARGIIKKSIEKAVDINASASENIR